MHNTSIAAVVLAAGKGTRMRSEKAKVLHKVAGKPILFYSLRTLNQLGLGQIITVIKYKKDDVLEALKLLPPTETVEQGEQYGTAAALKSSLSVLRPQIASVLSVYADNAILVAKATYQRLILEHKNTHATVTLATYVSDDPESLGRIIRDATGEVTAIVEEKDATSEQKRITEVNPGLYLFNRAWLEENIGHVEPSPHTGEYYVTDLLARALQQQKHIATINFGKTNQWLNISTQEDVQQADRLVKEQSHT